MADAALTARLREAAEIVADEARKRSAEFSETIPGSVRLTGGANRVTIAAGGASAPSAYMWEGKRGGRPRWHPLFGDREHWYPQLPVRPFLEEALEAKQDELLITFARVVDDWAHERGYR